MVHEEWNKDILKNLFADEIVTHLMTKVRIGKINKQDQVIWSLEAMGNFSVKSTWHYVRQSGKANDFYKQL